MVYVALRLWGVLIKERGDYYAVLAHMNPEFAIIAYPLTRALNKVLALWYSHQSVTWKLKVAASLVDVIFTTHPMNCRVGGHKVVVVGHGIKCPPITLRPDGDKIVLISRLSRSKRIEVVIEAFRRALREVGGDVKLVIYGEEVDRSYVSALRDLASRLNIHSRVHFKGPLPHSELAKALKGSLLLVSASTTGLDKAPLEAMSYGIPVLVSHPSYREVLKDLAPSCMFRDPPDLASKMVMLIGDRELRHHIGGKARQYVLELYELRRVVIRIYANLLKFYLAKLRGLGIEGLNVKQGPIDSPRGA